MGLEHSPSAAKGVWSVGIIGTLKSIQKYRQKRASNDNNQSLAGKGKEFQLHPNADTSGTLEKKHMQLIQWGLWVRIPGDSRAMYKTRLFYSSLEVLSFKKPLPHRKLLGCCS